MCGGVLTWGRGLNCYTVACIGTLLCIHVLKVLYECYSLRCVTKLFMGCNEM